MFGPREPIDNPLSLWQVFWSVSAAMFGVQKRENWERDFKHGNMMTFFIVGFIWTICFVTILVLAAYVAIDMVQV
ncbi:MAG: DUF2970 domain-containing protein [Magnetococcales bacterium]|nr:DUF2970 domain-containing protein [Magnetococcales bacterium]